MKRPAFQCLLISPSALLLQVLISLIVVSCTSPKLSVTNNKAGEMDIPLMIAAVDHIYCSGTFLNQEVKVEYFCRISALSSDQVESTGGV